MSTLLIFVQCEHLCIIVKINHFESFYLNFLSQTYKILISFSILFPVRRNTFARNFKTHTRTNTQIIPHVSCFFILISHNETPTCPFLCRHAGLCASSTHAPAYYRNNLSSSYSSLQVYNIFEGYYSESDNYS